MDDSDFMAAVILGLLLFGPLVAAFWKSARDFRRPRADLFRLPLHDSFPKGITVRPYQATDEKACLAIYASNTEFVPPTPELLTRSIDENPGTFFVAEIDGNIVACGGIVPAPDKAPCN